MIKSAAVAVNANNNQLAMYSAILSRARKAFATHKTKDIAFRKSQLKAVGKLLDENEALLCEAVNKDLGKCRFEAMGHELETVRNDIRTMLMNIDKWTKPDHKEKGIVTLFDSVYVHYEPYGVALIIGAWNYPIQLTIAPLVSAIAAGNCAIIKPSELAPHSAKAMAELLPRYLDKECYHIILGGPEETQQLLKEKFDYVFYTGSPRVGRLVNQAVAANMTPVTLELGGKSPVYLDDSIANLEVAWRRILWGKLINAGQTCIAPDYMLCTTDVQEKILESAAKIIREFYGEDPRNSPDYPRIINDNHFKRLKKLLDTTSGKIVFGGKMDEATRYISPTIVTGVSPDDPLMQEELFGPIIPILNVSSLDQAIEHVNRNEKPLSLYVFSNKSQVVKRFKEETSSGAVVVNDTVIHFCIDSLPFGGVGNSGLGAYHGRYSFETFSHGKAILHKDYNPLGEALAGNRYPPYNNTKLTILGALLQKRNFHLEYVQPIGIFLIGFGAAYLLKLAELL